MMNITRIIATCVAGIAMSLTFAHAATAVEVVVNPALTDTNKALRNPLKGNRGGPNGISNDKYSAVFRNYVTWDTLEPSYESDDVKAIKRIKDFFDTTTDYKNSAAAGNRFVFRPFLLYFPNATSGAWPSDMTQFDWSSPQFISRLQNLVRRIGLATRDDGRIAAIEMGIHGAWGEHHFSGSGPTQYPMPPNVYDFSSNGFPKPLQEIYQAAFTSSFVDTQVLRRSPGSFIGSPFGIYWDSFGHPGDLRSWNSTVANGGGDDWKTSLVSGEVAYRSGAEGYYTNDPNVILSTPVEYNWMVKNIRSTHASFIGSLPSGGSAQATGAAALQNAFGWTFNVTEARFPSRVAAGSDLNLQLSVRNVGSAPLYAGWPVGVALLNTSTLAPVWQTVMSNVDVRTWLPGEHFSFEANQYLTPAETHVVNSAISVPATLANGEYFLAISLLDPMGMKTNGRFNIKNFVANGWQPLGRVGINQEASSQSLPTFTDPNSVNLSYPFVRNSIPAITSPLAVSPTTITNGKTTVTVGASAPDGGAMEVTYLVFGPASARLSANRVASGTPVEITFPMAGDYEVQAIILNKNNGTSIRRSLSVPVADVDTTNPGPSIAIEASANPSTVTGTSTVLSVLGADNNGESNLTYEWTTIGTPPAPVTFSANGTNTAKTTVAMFRKAGTYDFQVTIRDNKGKAATDTVSVVVNSTLTTFTVSPESAKLSNSGFSWLIGETRDQFGSVLAKMTSGSDATYSKVSGLGTLSGRQYTAPATGSGSATVRVTMVKSPGWSAIARIDYGDTSGVVDAPPTITTATANPSTVTGTTTSLSVQGTDDRDVYNLKYNWTATGSPPDVVTFAPNGTNEAKSTQAMFRKPGIYNLRVLVADSLGQTAFSNVTVTVNATLTGMSVSPFSSTVANSASVSLAAITVNQFGGVMSPTIAWSIDSGGGIVSSSGNYTAPASGSGVAVIRATTTSGAAMSATATVNFGSGPVDTPPTIATPANATPSPVTGTSTTLSVKGADDSGELSLTYQWATTGTPPASVSFSVNGTNPAQSTVATFSKAGRYNQSATHRERINQTVTSNVTVTVQATPTSVVSTPSTSTIKSSESVTLAARALDQFGVDLTSQPTFGWTIVTGGLGAINSAGVYTAPASGTGTATIRATTTSGPVLSATSTVNYAPGSSANPSIATPASASPSTITGTTANLSVQGADADGESTLVYEWKTTGTPPAPVSFSPNGTNGAKLTVATFSKAGTYIIAVDIKDAGGLFITSTVTVQVDATITEVALTPSSISIINGTNTTFVSEALDQFADLLSPQPTFTWSLDSGLGTISSTGVYESPATGTGSATIRATTTSGIIMSSTGVVSYGSSSSNNNSSSAPGGGGGGGCGLGSGVIGLLVAFFLLFRSRLRDVDAEV